MTRFARLSGVKGSSEKRPEEATSWQEMRQGMINSRKKGTTVSEPVITEQEEEALKDEVKNIWAEIVSHNKPIKKKKLKVNSEDGAIDSIRTQGIKQKLRLDNMEDSPEAGTKVKRKRTVKDGEDGECLPMVHTINKKKRIRPEIIPQKPTKIKKKDKNKLKVDSEDVAIDPGKTKEGRKRKLGLDDKEDTPEVGIKVKRKKIVNGGVNGEGLLMAHTEKKKNRKKKMKKLKKEEDSPNAERFIMPKNSDTTISTDIEIKSGIKGTKKKNVDISETKVIEQNPQEPKLGREKKRRKAELKNSEVFINGRMVELAPFDGFIVTADRAEKLRDLRKTLIAKGVPEADRGAMIKLERRRAEKALARLKKQVCFHCRNTGHNLSECPEIERNDTPTGICYKCGSTEHTHFQCKVSRGQNFRYAECFICKEQGHIARQCPDNPRGLYPKGGGCSSCGDVTHLKRDCPKFLSQKDEDAKTVATQNYRALEAIDEDLEVKKHVVSKKLNKHIKF